LRQGTRLLAALAGVGLLLGAGCPLQTVRIQSPRSGLLTDDPALAVSVRIGRNFVHDASVVRLDGVDLIAALGLTPPFADAGGVVTIGPDPVTVSGFTYSIPAPPDPIVIVAEVAGLPVGDHTLEAEAQPTNGGASTLKSAPFAVVAPFARRADVIASAGTPPPGPVAGGNRAPDVGLGESLAAPPVPLAGGAGAVRAGFVAAARGPVAAP
jgi:hypothetical protein